MSQRHHGGGRSMAKASCIREPEWAPAHPTTAGVTVSWLTAGPWSCLG